MSGFLQDVRPAARIFSKAPGFSAIAVTTLALGIGAAVSAADLVDWRSQTHSFQDIAATEYNAFTLTG